MSDSAEKSQTWSRQSKVMAEGLFERPQGEREMSGMVDTGRLNEVGEIWLLGPSSPEMAEGFWHLGELVPVEKRNWCGM